MNTIDIADFSKIKHLKAVGILISSEGSQGVVHQISISIPLLRALLESKL